ALKCGGIDVEPESGVALYLHEVDVGAAAPYLIDLRTEVDPARSRVRAEIRVPGHLSDATEDDGDPVRVLDRPDVVLELDVGDLLPHVLLGIGSSGRCGTDLKVKLPPPRLAADKEGSGFQVCWRTSRKAEGCPFDPNSDVAAQVRHQVPGARRAKSG